MIKKQNIRYLIFMFFVCFILLQNCKVKAEDVVYSTVGGTWNQVNDDTWVMDKDGDGTTDITLIKEGDEWRYIFSVADDSTLYYGWEPNVPDGYEIENGYGTKQNPAVNVQYAHTENIDNEGTQNGNYNGGIDSNQIFTVPGAAYINILLTNDFANGDYMVIWEGNHPEYSAVHNSEQGIRIDQKQKNALYKINGDVITIGFHSEENGEKKYGYYAAITGDINENGFKITNASTEEEPLETSSISIQKLLKQSESNITINEKTKEDFKKVFRFKIKLTSDDTQINELLKPEKMYGDVVLEKGEGEFYLTAGQTIKIDNIPVGVAYTITEQGQEDYITSWTGSEESTDNTITGLVKNQDVILTCCNTEIKKPEKSKQNLTVQKIVEGESADNFTFHIAFENLEAETKYTYRNGTDEFMFQADMDRKADVMFTLSDKEAVIFEALPEGSLYQIVEDAVDNYTASYEIINYLAVVKKNKKNEYQNQSLSTEKEKIESNENATVIFTNKKDSEKQKIHIEKVWKDDENKSGARPNTILVYLYQNENMISSIALSQENNWQVDIDNLDMYQDDGKTENIYTIKEKEVQGYETDISYKDNNYTITNTKIKTGNLKISKTVKGENADTTKAFKFSISLQKEGKPVSGVYQIQDKNGKKAGSIAFDENGNATFELKDSDVIKIIGLPTGVTFSVRENYYQNYHPENNGIYTGVITEGDTEIAVTNIYKESYQLSIHKTVKGNLGDKTKNFHFLLKLTGEIPKGVEYEKGNETGILKIKNGTIEFTLMHGEDIVFKNLPEGIDYQVSEINADDYRITTKNSSGKLQSNTEVQFINVKNGDVPTSAMTNTIIMLLLVIISACILILLKMQKKHHIKKNSAY
mgnify:CR=1 FL=1